MQCETNIPEEKVAVSWTVVTDPVSNERILDEDGNIQRIFEYATIPAHRCPNQATSLARSMREVEPGVWQPVSDTYYCSPHAVMGVLYYMDGSTGNHAIMGIET